MNFLFPFFLLIIGGSITAYDYIVSRRPNAASTLQKLLPYKSMIGLTMFIYGLISFLSNLGSFFRGIRYIGLERLVNMSSWIIMAAIGFTLCYEILNEYLLSRNTSLEVRGKALQNQLNKIETSLGIAALIVAALLLLYHINVL